MQSLLKFLQMIERFFKLVFLRINKSFLAPLVLYLFCFNIYAVAPNCVKDFQSNRQKRLLYLPLDERFTTRDLFLADAQITDYKILTPDKSLLPQQKNPPNLENLAAWTRQTSKSANAAITSAEMLLYGGLIASRINTDSLSEVEKRLQILEEIHQLNPQLRLFISSTVTRIPAYSSSEEEPDYYAKYGREIFLYSFHNHRFETLKNEADKLAADTYRKQIPADVLNEFAARRTRNFEINKKLIELVRRKVIERLVITLDDNSEYGFSKKEAAVLEKLAAPLKTSVAVYAGADEAQLALLANLVAGKRLVAVYPVYHYPQSKNLIPVFEGAPLAESVERQIRAAGGYVETNLSKAECVLYVNNFEEKQTFPPKEITKISKTSAQLEQLLNRAGIASVKNKTLILADNRFYNGADAEFVASIFNSQIDSSQIAYAGWNTSGNTLGSAIALGILRQRMTENRNNLSFHKKLLFARFVEDWIYMIIGRERVRQIIKQSNSTDFAGTETERRAELEMKNLFNSEATRINRFLKSDYEITRVFFPWHRPFEVGFEVSEKAFKKR